MCQRKDEGSSALKLDERLKILPGGMVEISFSPEQCLALGAALLKGSEQAEGPAAEDYHLYSLLFQGAGAAAAATRQMPPLVLAELEGLLAGRARRLLGPEAEDAQ